MLDDSVRLGAIKGMALSMMDTLLGMAAMLLRVAVAARLDGVDKVAVKGPRCLLGPAGTAMVVAGKEGGLSSILLQSESRGKTAVCRWLALWAAPARPCSRNWMELRGYGLSVGLMTTTVMHPSG